MPARLVVLVSGTGTNLQALMDASTDPAYGVEIVAVGSDRAGTPAVQRARRAGIDTFEVAVEDYADREAWDLALADKVAGYQPDLVVSAGFMKLAGAGFLDRYAGRYLNTHPALLPAFVGIHAARDALAYGVKVSGATLFVVDAGIDTGPVVAQTVVPVQPDDTVDTLHERIKTAERAMLVQQVGRMAREGFTIDGRKVTIP